MVYFLTTSWLRFYTRVPVASSHKIVMVDPKFPTMPHILEPPRHTPPPFLMVRVTSVFTAGSRKCRVHPCISYHDSHPGRTLDHGWQSTNNKHCAMWNGQCALFVKYAVLCAVSHCALWQNLMWAVFSMWRVLSATSTACNECRQ